MNKNRTNIAIVDSSVIVYEGLSTILLQDSRTQYRLFHFDSLEEMILEMPETDIEVLILNPSLAIIDSKNLQRIRNNRKSILCIGILYSFFEKETLSLFDDFIQITDQPSVITETIHKLISSNQTKVKFSQKEQISQRETEVLQQLVKGLSNKEIADKLNISTHTVISHRKNIIQKTGIKSQAGLTIYAITNKIVNIEDCQDCL